MKLKCISNYKRYAKLNFLHVFDTKYPKVSQGSITRTYLLSSQEPIYFVLKVLSLVSRITRHSRTRFESVMLTRAIVLVASSIKLLSFVLKHLDLKAHLEYFDVAF